MRNAEAPNGPGLYFYTPKLNRRIGFKVILPGLMFALAWQTERKCFANMFYLMPKASRDLIKELNRK